MADERKASGEMPYLAIAITAVLIGASFKEFEFVVMDELSFLVPNNVVTSFIKQHADYFTVSGMFTFFATLLVRARFNQDKAKSTIGSMLICASLIASVRAFVDDSYSGTKISLGCVICISIYACTRANIASEGSSRTILRCIFGFAVYEIILTTLNIADFIIGNGFLTLNPRMFGSSSHPNFLAVQLATGLPTLAWYGIKNAGFSASICILLTAAAFFLIMQTGSRTGLTIVLGEAFLFVWIKRKLPPLLGLLIPSLVILLAFISIDLFDLGSVFDAFERGGNANTRNDAWIVMIDQISKNPIFGYGRAVLASENSFLRSWVMYGIIYAALIMLLFILTTFRLVDAASKSDQISSITPIACMAGGLLFGSAFEGYLTDSFTVPVVFIAVSAALADGATGRLRPGTGARSDNAKHLFAGNQFYRKHR